MLAFVMVFVSWFGRWRVRNVLAGYTRILRKDYGFVYL